MKVIDTEIYNNNQLGGTNRAGIQLQAGAEATEIDGCKIYDNQGTPTQSYGVQALGGDHSFTNGQIKNNAVDDINLSGGGTVETSQLKIGDDPLSGQITLSAGTSTVITNDNARSPSQLILLAANSQARGFQLPSAQSVVKGVSFTINHNTAAGDEIYNYKIY
ncbi:hypothetical protein BA3_0047 [Thalassomonas phage BA3]|uniref:hypothetical protein n=1 Tax=Thalassomonas phage BA3 TaxID=469660 RepID=UPI00015D95BE|nr:hypothetical protein BA3_0047 [Thalassomonas phage BA3]ABV74332.1 hypothetical protein BA3_0047 [Thalassomonas phage BA3]